MTDIVLIFYDLYFLIFRILAIKSGPSSGIKVFLQQSQKDNKNRVILPDVKWQSVGADYQQVDLSKFEGRNFASKLELLLATFSHDSSSSSSWNKLFSSLLLRFLKHVHTAVLVLEGLLTLFACQGFIFDNVNSLKYWKLVKKVWGRGLHCWRFQCSSCAKESRRGSHNYFRYCVLLNFWSKKFDVKLTRSVLTVQKKSWKGIQVAKLIFLSAFVDQIKESDFNQIVELFTTLH